MNEFVIHTLKMNEQELKFQVKIAKIEHNIMYDLFLLFLFDSYQKRAIIRSTYHINELDT